jgi:hypothetical protein
MLLWALASLAPFIIAYLVGLAISLARWRQHPRKSLLVAIACFLGLANLGAGWTARMILPRFLGASNTMTFMMALNVATSLVGAAVLALLLGAALSRWVSGAAGDSAPAEPEA